MTDKKSLWLNEILDETRQENAKSEAARREAAWRKAEEDDMADQPTGATVAWAAACVLVWLAVAAVVYIGFFR
jgi:hypothetical protein